MPEPEPGPGEVRVRVTLSAVSPGDTKKRSDWLGFGMPFPRVIPHSDASGVIDAVGDGVGRDRIGRRVWVHGAQSGRPFGTAAQATVVPSDNAVDLPDAVSDELGACLGIPGITAHRTVFGDGSVAGKTVLVHGVLGGVGRLAAQLAADGGARVIGTVRRASDVAEVDRCAVAVIDLSGPGPASRIREAAPEGVDRVVEVELAGNVVLDAEVCAPGAVIAAYASSTPQPAIPFWPMLFANHTIRMLGSDDFPGPARTAAVRALTEAAAGGVLHVPAQAPLTLDRVADAHERVDGGTRERVLLDPGS